MFAALWGSLVLGVSLAYRGGDATATWIARVIMLAVAALVTTVVVLIGRSSWDRAVSRPYPIRGASRWAARQPGWLLAAICWAPLAALVTGLGLGLSMPRFYIPMMLTSTGFTVTGTVAQSKVIWERQLDRQLLSHPGNGVGDIA